MLNEFYGPIRSHVLERDRQAGELIQRIRKLRWIGMHDEAEEMAISLCRLGNERVVLAEASDTD